MPDKDNQQNIDIVGIQKDIYYIKKDIIDIKVQVFNHLPTKIDKLSEGFQEYKISNGRWLIGILISTLFILIGTIINLLK